MSTFTIGQVAERSGFSASALRYYEDIGLVVPANRTESGYRLYDDKVLGRLAFIARAKQLGCSLGEITDLVDVWDGERCGPVQRRFHELVTDKLHATQTQITELIAFAGQLQTTAARLDGPTLNGPCRSGCACLAENDSLVPSLVTLSMAASNEPPIACTLQPTAMPGRIERWRAVLAHVRARVRTADGRLRLEMQHSTDLSELAYLVAVEQQCCAFFAFVLTIDERGIALEIDSPDEAAEIVSAMFGTAAEQSQRSRSRHSGVRGVLHRADPRRARRCRRAQRCQHAVHRSPRRCDRIRHGGGNRHHPQAAPNLRGNRYTNAREPDHAHIAAIGIDAQTGGPGRR